MNATQSSPPAGASAPSKILAFTEISRAAGEFAAFMAMRPLLRMLPKGDGHSVLVLPGFLASDRTSSPMRKLLAELGYDPHGWGLGANVRINNRRMQEMQDVLAKIHADSGRKVSLIGWSLGGLFARELAKLNPGAVRQVITLGSPISRDRSHSNSTKLFEMLNGKEPEPIRDGLFVKTEEAPPVPTTSILSRADGIVHWRGSVQQPDPANSFTENIQVASSHVGLGFNPSVIVALADRLRLAEGEWSPFEPKFHQRWMFPQWPLPGVS